jgi:hypothetical protein
MRDYCAGLNCGSAIAYMPQESSRQFLNALILAPHHGILR